MASKNRKRLALLLPTVVLLSHGLPSQTGALELQASDYVGRLLSSLSSQDYGSVQHIADTLRRCGVDAVTTSEGSLTLEQIEQLAADLKAGKTVSIPGGGAENAFVVGSINQLSVQCAPSAEVTNTASILSPPASPTSV